MKNIIKYICAAFAFMLIASCNPYNTWPDGDPALEHVYYVSVVKTGNGASGTLEFEIAANGVARHLRRIHGTPETTVWEYSDELNVTNPIPFRFIS